MAYWINLYNAVTLQIVLERYPVNSIRQIRSRTLDPRGLIGPWFERRIKVENRSLSLYEVENAILRKEFDDPRLHYAINCASNSCPSLQPKAWTAGAIETDLAAAAAGFLNSQAGVRVGADGRASVSPIFKWYSGDFSKAGGAAEHIAKYASPDISSKLAASKRTRAHSYDWMLNDAEPE